MKHFATTLLATTLLAGPALAQTASPPASSADISTQTRTLHNDLYAYTGGIIAALKAQPTDAAKLDALSGKLDVLHTDLASLLAQLKSGTNLAPIATAGSAASTPAADPYFPPKSGDALFPSPENSRSLRVGTEIQGKPYLINAAGMTYQLTPDITGTLGVTINGKIFPQGDDHAYMTSLIERGGNVYAGSSGGQWKEFHTDTSSWYNGYPPDAVTPQAAAAKAASDAAAAASPVGKVASTFAFGSGKLLTFGAGQAYPTAAAAINAAQDGDTVKAAPGAYHEAVPSWSKKLKIDISGAQFDFTGLTSQLAYGKGGFVSAADSMIVGDATTLITGVAMDQDPENTCAIRPSEGTTSLVIKGINAHGNQCALGGGGFPVYVELDDSDISSNGLTIANDPNGMTHNAYMSNGTTVVFNNVISLTPTSDHAAKFRSDSVAITGGSFSSTRGSVLDFPNGSKATVTIIGAKISKDPGAENHAMISYGTEGASVGTAGLLMVGGSINALCDNPLIQTVTGATITLQNVSQTGNKITAAGGSVVGLTP